MPTGMGSWPEAFQIEAVGCKLTATQDSKMEIPDYPGGA